MWDGSDYINQIGGVLFADPELTSLDALPEVWGRRAPWTHSLAAIRDRIADQTRAHFRVARCAYYEDGAAGTDFHADLPAYGSTSAIASLSLGAKREFAFRLAADPEHCHQPRINLTFRKYGWD